MNESPRRERLKFGKFSSEAIDGHRASKVAEARERFCLGAIDHHRPSKVDEIRCACRGIRRPDSINVCSHSDEGSGLGVRKMREYFVDFDGFL